jgi:hypothetical protein
VPNWSGVNATNLISPSPPLPFLLPFALDSLPSISVIAPPFF